jgi:excisionase family DNA binding protein
MENEKMYTVREVAEMFGVNPNTVRTWIRHDKIEAITLGTRAGYRITQDALDRFIQSRKTQ